MLILNRYEAGSSFRFEFSAFLNGHEDRLASSGRGELNFIAAIAEGGHGVANGFSNGNREHKRRFANGFAAINNILLCRVLQE
jgi:hypothetical protein